jgi:hypothetical protein
MKVHRVAFRFVVLVALLALPATGVMAQGNSGKGLTAHAEWSYVYPYEGSEWSPECLYTEGVVTVTQTTTHQPPGPPQVEVVLEDFVYQVSNSLECWFEVLDYNYVWLPNGPVVLDADDFTVHPGLQWATLDTVFQAYEEEGGVWINLAIRIEWTATGKGQGQWREATARIEVLSGMYDVYIDNPVITDDAYIAKVR